jgi:hypothetical protein
MYCHCAVVSFLKSCYGFREIQCSERHILLEGINEILAIFSTFFQMYITFIIGDVHKNLLSDCEFSKNQCSESHAYLGA